MTVEASSSAAGGVGTPPAERDSQTLGLLGPVALVASLGVLAGAFAATGSRLGDWWARPAFWVAMLLITVPAFARLCVTGSRRERLGTVVVFTLALYAVKVAYDPTAFSFSDEFVHWRSTIALLRTNHLFTFNPLLPIASHYPGLPGVTAEVQQLTGLHIPAAGYVVVGTSRLALILLVFHLVERLSGSSRAAGIASAIYAANPNFLYWDAQFSYESLGLTFAFLVLFLTDRAEGRFRSVGFWSVTGLAVVACVVTHHLSTFGLIGALAVWSLATRFSRTNDRRQAPPVALLVLTVTLTVVWLVTAAPGTFSYVGGIFSAAGSGIVHVLTGQGGTRQLFVSGASAPPVWERIVSYASVAALLLALLITLRPAIRTLRAVPLATVGVLLAVSYPFLLPLRFVGAAQETANRSVEWAFLGLGLVIAMGAIAWMGVEHRRRTVLMTGFLLLVFIGGVTVSWQYSEQLPPSKMYSGVPNDVDSQAASAATWTAAVLGVNRRFASDQIDDLALATYGYQRILWRGVDGVSAWQIFLPNTLTPAVVDAVRRGHVQYLLVQSRLTRGIPSSGIYFNKGEPDSGKRRAPLSPASLTKFDYADGVSRLLDTGDIRVYDVRHIHPNR